MEVRSRLPDRSTPPPLPSPPTPEVAQSNQENKSRKGKILLYVFLTLFIIYLIPPIVLRYSSWLRDALIFVHHVKTPFFGNISDPASFGIKSTRQFELFHEDGCGIEVWQILPKQYHHGLTQISPDEYISALSDGSPVILYLHGNTGTRARYHRVKLYQHISEVFGYHIITFDYRGYGNSECYPSERKMMEDGRLVWRWLREKTSKAKIYIWGHSLGSAVGTYLVKDLCQTQDCPSGVILDAPFTDMLEEISNHPFTVPYRPVMSPFLSFSFGYLVDKFESVQRIGHITCPILILHGQWDTIVPFHLGKKMYRAAIESRKGKDSLEEVEFLDCGFTGHKDNWKSPNAQDALVRFIQP